jgi:putative DNA primase/helicase
VQFVDFCRANGLIVDACELGRWKRVRTVDHPNKLNGAYKFLGHIGWVQNHATQVEVSQWRSEGEMTVADKRLVVQQAAEFERKMREGHARAAARAQLLINECLQMGHSYLDSKGFHGHKALVTQDGALVIPMRALVSNFLVGAQLIRRIPGSDKFEKKMLPGMRARGAVLRLGSRHAPVTWLVEGYATGLSVEAAITLRRQQAAVLVCFSDGNLAHVGTQLETTAMVFADNDVSGAGERAAVNSGRPYCMSPTVGEDANDMHVKRGLLSVAGVMASVQLEAAMSG